MKNKEWPFPHLLIDLKHFEIEQRKSLELVKKSFEDLLSDGYVPNVVKLNQARLFASNTLNRGSEINMWESANLYINDFINQGILPDLEKIMIVNGFFTEDGSIRDQQIYSGADKFLDINLLEEGISLFQDKILDNLENDDPLYRASQIYQWLTTLHLFNDANGRTARLITDWYLLLKGYAPICFHSPITSFVSCIEGGRIYSVEHAYIVICKAVRSSYLLLKS